MGAARKATRAARDAGTQLRVVPACVALRDAHHGLAEQACRTRTSRPARLPRRAPVPRNGPAHRQLVPAREGWAAGGGRRARARPARDAARVPKPRARPCAAGPRGRIAAPRTGTAAPTTPGPARAYGGPGRAGPAQPTRNATVRRRWRFG